MPARTPRPSLLAIAIATVTAIAVAIAGCGGGGGDATAQNAPSGSSKASGGSSGGVAISGFAFKPATITVKAGDQLKLTNEDDTAHTATADDGHSFNTGDIDPGSSKTISAKPGTYAYHCSIHPFMHGKLVVQ
jgi:plastocyanin